MQTQEKKMRIINHKTMRVIIGVIALAMPTLVLLISDVSALTSISISYWTDARDIFVGSLFAVAFFLTAYNGTGLCGKVERGLSIAGFVCAILIALFPTLDFEPIPPEVRREPASWIVNVSDFFRTEYVTIHHWATGILFACLFFMMLIFSLRAARKGKTDRSRWYLGICLLMSVGMLVLYFLLNKYGNDTPTFWVELSGLGLFGIGWLSAGWYKTEQLVVPPGSEELKSYKDPNNSNFETGVVIRKKKDDESGDYDYYHGEELKTVYVDPKNPNYKTEIEVEAGQQYYFLAKGCWKDWFVHCGPNGWGHPKWKTFWHKQHKKRMEDEAFFKLCGKVGRVVMNEGEELNEIEELKTEEQQQGKIFLFAIGEECFWTVPEEVITFNERKLYLFANDRTDKYGNNKALGPEKGGPLEVTIYLLKRLQNN